MLLVPASRWCCGRGSGATWCSFVLLSVGYFAAGRLLASGNTGSSKRWKLFLAFWGHVFLSLCLCVAERCKEVHITWSDICCYICYVCSSGSIYSLFCGEFCCSYSIILAPILSLQLCVKVNLKSKRNYVLWKRGKENPTQNSKKICPINSWKDS